MEHNKSVCILRLSALGDCINAFGMIGAIRQTWPGTSLTWVIDRRFAPLFCDEQDHDLVSMHRVDFKGNVLSAALQLRREMKDELAGMAKSSFDVLLNMQTSIKSSLCSLAIAADSRYGYDSERSREGQKFFVNRKVTSPENPHVLAGFMAFAQACGLPVAEPYWNFNLDPYIVDRARCLVAHEKVFAICPCSANASKNWNVEGYVAMARHSLDHGMCPVLLGGNAQIEHETCAAIAAQCPEAVNLCGRTTLRELAAMLSISRLVLAPDSGSMHLASALGTPVIGLFARHDDHRVGPWNFMDLNVSVYHRLARQEIKNGEIPWRYRVRQDGAMDQITLDMVQASFERAIDVYRI